MKKRIMRKIMVARLDPPDVGRISKSPGAAVVFSLECGHQLRRQLGPKDQVLVKLIQEQDRSAQRLAWCKACSGGHHD